MNELNSKITGLDDWWKKFREDLGFWTFHCVIGALPGFCFAMWLLKLSVNQEAVFAMVAALLTMVILVTSLASFSGTLTRWKTLPSRGLAVALQVRGISTMASLMVIGTLVMDNNGYENPVIMFMPDIWAGVGSTIVVSLVSAPFGLDNPLAELSGGGTDIGFLTIYLIAIVDALLLCFLMFIIAFISMLVIQMRDRKKLYGEVGIFVPAILRKIRSMGDGKPIRKPRKAFQEMR